jgi:hypothetical protein
LVSRSMDNRLGSYVALEVARRCSERGGLTGSVAGVAAVQEEIGLYGAFTSAYMLEPDVAVVVDVTHATDAPGSDEKQTGSHPLGSGPVICRGSTLSPKVFELLAETAEREGIDHTIEVSGRSTRTDADAYQISRAGIATALVSIPLRYALAGGDGRPARPRGDDRADRRLRRLAAGRRRPVSLNRPQSLSALRVYSPTSSPWSRTWPSIALRTSSSVNSPSSPRLGTSSAWTWKW